MGKQRGDTERAQPYATGLREQGLEAEADRARADLVRQIAARGAFDGDEVWQEIFASVPRHLFVPWYYIGVVGGYERLWGEDPDPERRLSWVRGAYTDGPLATRIRDGELLSSSSQPSLMARMLTDLRVRDGDRVLEIGAGTGYNAALLAARVGEDRVTTVDLDPEITESARSHLAAAGWAPAVVTGDGFLGCPPRAPFDRIIATCTLASIPGPWLRQCAPGARILAPLSTGLIALDVQGPAQAEGRFLETSAFFVPLRGTARPDGDLVLSGLPPRVLGDDGFRFLATLGAGALDPEEALAVWETEGAPRRERFGITVHGDRQWAWLDDPEGAYRWQL
ncbi:methyltransferase domain-containing protein [Streptomyces physcomitrii]|uniref:Protein-L-isoaspartate O-methyltransferase n=1 Tax=Streptomyces physcomitrii TaxID=2724184 RepID=A0ABX1H5L8_9ACTN|nr:methyltransferase domain-containing protein [Streptomyces physcomitrii]NKI42585.1 methyltransferase domain-containing protein [Streptomyces physcomitrii]